jgi:hypothetical protein
VTLLYKHWNAPVRMLCELVRTCWRDTRQHARDSAWSRASQVELTTQTLYTAYVRRSEGIAR